MTGSDDLPSVLLEKISKRFSSSPRWAVESLSFTCFPGEIIGLLGENGAGKTTTLRMLATTILPTAGRAVVAGHDVALEPAAVRRSIGILFGGNTGLYERLSARENILYFARLNGMRSSEADRALADTAELLQMNSFLDRRAGTFSSGMRQKTSIARSIIHRPRVLLLDEPAAGLDVSASLSIYSFIKSYRDLGNTVLFSSHDMAAAERLCDRVVIIDNGISLRSGKPREIAADVEAASLEEAFVSLVRRGLPL